MIEKIVSGGQTGNVAGPRESGWPGACAYTTELIRRFLTLINR